MDVIYEEVFINKIARHEIDEDFFKRYSAD